MQVGVRRAEVSDIVSLEAVINQHWKVNVDHHKEMSNDDAILLVAEIATRPPSTGSSIVGTGLMWIKHWNKTGYLVELAVDRDHHRKGIGKALVDEFSRLARVMQLRAIVVETQPGNKEGMDFYLASGFRLCGYNDRYYTNHPKTSQEIALFFSLDLDH